MQPPVARMSESIDVKNDIDAKGQNDLATNVKVLM